MTGTPRPLFVLGLQRSGTTLAANLLAAHPDIAAVTAERHRGVHESVFFSHFARIYGDWNDPDARARAVQAFLDSDYFLLTGLARDSAINDGMAAAQPGDFFRAVMDALAQRLGRIAWVEKSPHHTLLADEIATALPDACFLCVRRDSADLLRSRLWSYGRVPPPYPRRAAALLRGCASNRFHIGQMEAFARRVGPKRALFVDFDALRADPDAALAPFLEAAGLATLGGARPAFAANSSFKDQDQRARALTQIDTLVIRAAEAGMRALPQPVLAALRRRIAARRPLTLPAWVWPDSAAHDRVG